MFKVSDLEALINYIKVNLDDLAPRLALKDYLMENDLICADSLKEMNKVPEWLINYIVEYDFDKVLNHILFLRKDAKFPPYFGINQYWDSAGYSLLQHLQFLRDHVIEDGRIPF